MKRFSEIESLNQNEGMKNKIIGGLAALSMMISSCQSITPEEKAKLKAEIEVLNKEEQSAGQRVAYSNQEANSKQNQISNLNDQIKELETKLGILKSGHQPRYILEIEVQEHKFELSLDRISFKLEIPVDEKFYNESEVGKELGEGSRSFSLGHSADATVTNKRIERN